MANYNWNTLLWVFIITQSVSLFTFIIFELLYSNFLADQHLLLLDFSCQSNVMLGSPETYLDLLVDLRKSQWKGGFIDILDNTVDMQPKLVWLNDELYKFLNADRCWYQRTISYRECELIIKYIIYMKKFNLYFQIW